MVALSSRVAPVQRFTRRSPCPVCGGWQSHGCWGFYSDDGRYAFCTAEVFAGALDLHPRAQAYRHLLAGACHCGVEHGGALDPSELYERIPEARQAPEPKRSHHQKRPTAIYDKYNNPNVRKLRYGSGKGKYFVWQRADGQGDWVNGLDGQTPGLYNGAALATADPFQPIYITEGEGDAEQVIAAGGVAISPSGGADSWEEEYSERLRGFLVIVCGDLDASGKGQAHAQHVAESIARQGAAVRLVFFGDTHDVGDYLKAGHTLAEVRALASASPAIAARMPETETLSGAIKLETWEAQPCKQCARLREQLRIAEASITNLRARFHAHKMILSAPKEQIPASLKPASIATYEALTSQRRRDEDGRLQVSCAAIAKRTGAAVRTTGAQLRALDKLGVIDSKAVKVPVITATGATELHTVLRIKEGPLFHKPQEIQENELAKRHGGARPRCKVCGSHNLKATEYGCADCGAIMTRFEALPPEPPETPNLSGAIKLETREEWSDEWSEDDADDLMPDEETRDSLLSPIPLKSVTPLRAEHISGDGGSCWVGGRVPDCEHPERMRHPTNPRLCGCGARFIPALDSAEVRTLTRRHGD